MTWYFSSKGFSFIGVLFIVLALGISTTVVVVSVQPRLTEDRHNRSLSRMDDLKRAIAEYSADAGEAPGELLDLLRRPDGVQACAVDESSRTLQGWCGPYMRQTFEHEIALALVDGWGREIQYDGSAIRSCGANGQCGDSDDLVLP